MKKKNPVVKVDKSFTDVKTLPSWAIDEPMPMKDEKPKPRGPRMTIETDVPGLEEKAVDSEFTISAVVILKGVRSDETAKHKTKEYELEVTSMKVEG